MANAVIMPKAGITVESCIIGTWEKKVGDSVKVGDILFTYETDKASFECESTEEGTLLEIFFQDGDEGAANKNNIRFIFGFLQPHSPEFDTAKTVLHIVYSCRHRECRLCSIRCPWHAARLRPK